MIPIIVLGLWFAIVIPIFIGKAKKKKSIVPTDQLNPHNNNVLNSWIINYIKDKGGQVDLDAMKNDLSKYLAKELGDTVRNMATDNIVSYGIDTEKLTEYVKLENDYE